MTSVPRMLLIGGCLGILMFDVGTSAALAQGQDSNVKLESGLIAKKPKPGLPDVRPQPLAWPRLDAGAVLCRTEGDLDRLAARRHGEVVDGPVDCQVLRGPTAIAIVQRAGTGRTEVKVTAAKTSDTGWTDAWLPEKSPLPAPGSRSASR